MTLREIANKFPDLRQAIQEDVFNGEDVKDIQAFYERIALERINNEFFDKYL